MFGQLLRDGARLADREVLLTPRISTTWGQLAALVSEVDAKLRPLQRQRVGLIMRPHPVCLAALAALDDLQCDTYLLDGQLDAKTALQRAADLNLRAVVQYGESSDADHLQVDSASARADGSGSSSVVILTSGTEGRPKAARHIWKTLSRPVRKGRSGQRWLLTYRPHLYAGLQVLLQCLLNHGTLVAAEANAHADEVIQLMRDGRVEHASATPSYWRQLLLFGNHQLLRDVSLQSITLGGEVVDQPILDALRDQFPSARIVHIYATTELGRCFSVSDGQAGFPLRLLDTPSGDGIEIKVEGGELFVRSPNSMVSYAPTSLPGHPMRQQTADVEPGVEWFATGDLVKIEDERACFVGRRSETINVGGNKVHPIEVEGVVRSVPGVADARVYGKDSSIAGQLVACQIVPKQGHDPEALRRSIAAQCTEALPSFQRPRVIDVVDRIELTQAGKSARAAEK